LGAGTGPREKKFLARVHIGSSKVDAPEEVTAVGMTTEETRNEKKKKNKKRERDETVLLARVGTPDLHETRHRDGKRYTELRLEGKKVKRRRSRLGSVDDAKDEVDDIFVRDDLGRFLTRAKGTPSLDKYLEDFYASNLAKTYARAGEPRGLVVVESRSTSASTSVATPTTPIPHDTVPRTVSGGVTAWDLTPRTPSPPSAAPTYANGVKTWRGRSIDVAEIECAVIVDYATRVKRLPPCVPRVLRHDARRSVGSRSTVEYSLGIEHIENVSRASVVDPKGRHADPTLAAFVDGDDSRRDPDGFKRRLDGVFVQILLALGGLQRHCGFVHNDLHTKNVLLKAREGTGPLVVHDGLTGRRYVFEDDVPLVKIIDFGDAIVRHPETGRVVSARWTGHIQGFTNGADIRRLAIVLARHAGERASALFSSELIADIVSIIDPIDGDVSVLDDIVASANANSNVERFGFPLTGFATPTKLLETGRVARRFVDGGGQTTTHVAPKNIFHELPEDGWSSTRPFAWFARREFGVAPREYAPCRPLLPTTPPEIVKLRDHAVSALGKRLDVDPNFETRPERRDLDAVVAYGPSADTRTRRRVAWTGLVLFQRAVVFYLRTFVASELTGSVDVGDVGGDDAANITRLIERRVNEIREMVDETVATANVTSDEERLKKKSEATRLMLRLCLVAACGGHGQFFSVAALGRRWWDAVAKVTEAYDAAYDAGIIVAPAETIVRDIDQVETRAYADEKRREGAGPTVVRLFEWSGDCASAYSFDHKTLENLVGTN